MYLFTLLLATLCYNLVPATASAGDRSNVYQNCLKYCVKRNCTSDGYEFSPQSTIEQDVWCKLVGWTCTEECRYACMWKTVKVFEEQGGYVPKFHGKWPFTRMLGMQEPASVVASLLNFATNAYMYVKIHNEFRSLREPLVPFWYGFATVCMNAWMWSSIFHTRDTEFTEFMDYACAFSMIMALFVAAIVRVFYLRKECTTLMLGPQFLVFINHVKKLYAGKIDYDLNMRINILFGVLGSLMWLIWSGFQWAAGRRYVWRLIAFIMLSAAALSLEVLDFPPKYNWDAHALWHLSTAPLPLLFYRFVIDDLRWIKTRLDESELKTA